MKYPRVVWEGDQLWLRCQVDGTERECELSIGAAFVMLKELVAALAALCRR